MFHDPGDSKFQVTGGRKDKGRGPSPFPVEWFFGKVRNGDGVSDDHPRGLILRFSSSRKEPTRRSTLGHRSIHKDKGTPDTHRDNRLWDHTPQGKRKDFLFYGPEEPPSHSPRHWSFSYTHRPLHPGPGTVCGPDQPGLEDVGESLCPGPTLGSGSNT